MPSRVCRTRTALCTWTLTHFHPPHITSTSGGASIRIGGGIIGAGAVTGQFGAGQGVFVGGGVLVDVGHQIQNTFAALVRGSFGMMSVGAGVGIFIGE